MVRNRNPQERENFAKLAVEYRALAEQNAQSLHEASIKFVTPRHGRREVLKAIGANVAMIQNWQTRNQVRLDADVVRDGQEWRLYSDRDALLLGIAVRLSEVGFRASLLQIVLDQAKRFLVVGSHYLSSARPSHFIVLADGQVIGPQIGSSIDIADVPRVGFIVIRLDRLIRDALEPLGVSMTVGNASEHAETVDRLDEQDPDRLR